MRKRAVGGSVLSSRAKERIERGKWGGGYVERVRVGCMTHSDLVYGLRWVSRDNVEMC